MRKSDYSILDGLLKDSINVYNPNAKYKLYKGISVFCRGKKGRNPDFNHMDINEEFDLNKVQGLLYKNYLNLRVYYMIRNEYIRLFIDCTDNEEDYCIFGILCSLSSIFNFSFEYSNTQLFLEKSFKEVEIDLKRDTETIFQYFVSRDMPLGIGRIINTGSVPTDIKFGLFKPLIVTDDIVFIYDDEKETLHLPELNYKPIQFDELYEVIEESHGILKLDRYE